MVQSVILLILIYLLLSVFGFDSKQNNSAEINSNISTVDSSAILSEASVSDTSDDDDEDDVSTDNADTANVNSVEVGPVEHDISVVEAYVEPPETIMPHIRIELEDAGWDIFKPNPGVGDYRYGSSLIVSSDRIDAYFAAPGDAGGELDSIVHKYSYDGGITWSDESVVLTPMPLSRDCLSVCDPDVFFYDGYYYLGYTGTMDASGGGVVNNAFIARSEHVDGPFEKWNGSGWGGNPVPLVYYDGLWECWGVGEPAFVVHGTVLYVYCTRAGASKDGGSLCETMVYTADLTDDEWPAHLSCEGIAINRTAGGMVDDYLYDNSDSWDVVYDESQEKFIAISTNRRFTRESCLLYYESEDGVHFKRVTELNSNVYCGCHNSGLSSDKYGHVNHRMTNFLAYSYGGSDNRWGTWATRLVPINIFGTDDVDMSEDEADNIQAVIERGDQPGRMSLPASVRTESLVKYIPVGKGEIKVSYSYRNGSGKVSKVDSQYEVSLDTSCDKGITINYNGTNRQVKYCILSHDIFSARNTTHGGVKRFFSPVDCYRISLSDPYIFTIRPLLEYNDYNLYEFTKEALSLFNVSYKSMDSGICLVSSDGVLTPVSEGETSVIVSFQNICSFEVTISINS